MSAPVVFAAEADASGRPAAKTKANIDSESECFICLQGASPGKPLASPCKCPRQVHAACMATWQLHRSGNKEERQCRFCSSDLPPPFAAFAADHVAPPDALLAAVVYNDQVYKIPVRPGPEGRAEFKATVKKLFGLAHTNFDCTFDTKLPNSDAKLQLSGWECYDTATRCAALAAMSRSSAPPIAAGADASASGDAA